MAKKIMGWDYSHDERIKILIYLVIGGTAALVEWGLFYVFAKLLGISYLVATTLAFTLATIFHYILTNMWVFSSGVRYERGKELTLVLVVSFIGLAWNLLLMRIFVGSLGMDGMLAKMLASAIVVVWNYLARKKWIY